MAPPLKSAFLAVLALAILGVLAGLFLHFPNGNAAPASPAGDVQTAQASTLSDERLAAALSERAIGDKDAPVTLYEHSSLSCSHCASFHKDTLPRLKTDYVDTGKIRIVFRDFPLNAPALTGTVLARCLPEARYYDFITVLFETQEQWLKSDDPTKILRQNAALAGLSPADAESCLSSEALRRGIAERMEEVGKRLGVESTPTFAVNDDPNRKIVGAGDYEQFRAAIEEALAKKSP